MIMKIQSAQAMPVNTDPHYSKELPSNIDYKRLSSYFAFMPHGVIQNTLRQTTQLAKSDYPLPYETSSQEQVSDAKI
jgi:hypothetical protein